MNNSVKIYLNIKLQGSTLTRKSEADVINYVVKAKDVEPNKKYRGRDGEKVIRKGSFKHYSYEIKPATLHVNLSYDAYNYMSSNECPSWMKQRDWSRMSKIKRIDAHMNRICENYQGLSYNFEVLDD